MRAKQHCPILFYFRMELTVVHTNHISNQCGLYEGLAGDLLVYCIRSISARMQPFSFVADAVKLIYRRIASEQILHLFSCNSQRAFAGSV